MDFLNTETDELLSKLTLSELIEILLRITEEIEIRAMELTAEE